MQIVEEGSFIPALIETTSTALSARILHIHPFLHSSTFLLLKTYYWIIYADSSFITVSLRLSTTQRESIDQLSDFEAMVEFVSRISMLV